MRRTTSGWRSAFQASTQNVPLTPASSSRASTRSVLRARRDSYRLHSARGTTASKSATWYQSSTSTEKPLTGAAVAGLAVRLPSPGGARQAARRARRPRRKHRGDRHAERPGERQRSCHGGQRAAVLELVYVRAVEPRAPGGRDALGDRKPRVRVRGSEPPQPRRREKRAARELAPRDAALAEQPGEAIVQRRAGAGHRS